MRSDIRAGELERLSFGEWAAQLGLAEAGADADPDGDGLSLAVEYAFQLDPHTPEPPPSPEFSLRRVTTEGLMQTYIHFDRDPRRTSATIHLETSPDLTNWQTVTTSTLGAPASFANESMLMDGSTRVFVTWSSPEKMDTDRSVLPVF